MIQNIQARWSSMEVTGTDLACMAASLIGSSIFTDDVIHQQNESRVLNILRANLRRN